jgi:transposase
MAGATNEPDLFPEEGVPAGVAIVNERCVLRTQDGHRIVLVSGIVLAQYSVGDAMAEANAMVSLVDQGWADQVDVSRAFECSTRTVRRYLRRFEEGGLAALGRSAGYPRGQPRVRSSRSRLVSRLKGAGHSNREIARRIGVSEVAVRKLLRRLGWAASRPVQGRLSIDVSSANPNLSAFTAPTAATAPAMASPSANPNLSAFAAPTAATAPAMASPSANPNLSAFAAPTATRAPAMAPPRANPNLSAFTVAGDEEITFTLDTDPANRRSDRLLACLGLLDDAAPLFSAGVRVPRAGVLLALPAIIDSGVLNIARDIYGSIGPAFYGLRTTVVAMLLIALLRIKRPEDLKEHLPEDLGRLLGLDRAPEVKTLRRKLTRLAALSQAAAFGRALAQKRVATRGAAFGFLYVDGHVRVYHGKHTLPKTHVAQMRRAMPATSDYWVNDAAGEPLFVITAEANAGMVKMLPIVLAEIRTLLPGRRVTIVFDRGGWSPKLFATLIAEGFDVLTYRKGRFPRIAKRRFQIHTAVIDGRERRYLLAEHKVRFLGGKLRLRQVTLLSDDGQHQTPILTSRMDLSLVEVAFRMFERWRQENFFKYLRQEYALDALVDYQVEPANPERDVPNPARKALDKKLAKARDALRRLRVTYGMAAFANPEALRPSMRGFKNAHAHLGKDIGVAMRRVATLEQRRAKMPARVPVGQVVEGPVIKLATERKLLTNLFKMLAYQAESDLFRLVVPHYKRAEDEGRTLIQSALNGQASIEVTDKELRVTLAPLSSAHRTRAIAALCAEMDQRAAMFPGTRLRLRYAVEGAP